MPTRELDRGWEGAVTMKVECLEHMDVMFVTIMANDSFLWFDTDFKSALTNTFFSSRKGGISVYTQRHQPE